MNELLLSFGVILVACAISGLVFKHLLKLRAEPEEEANKVRQFFKLLSEDLSKTKIGELTTSESGSTFIQTTDHWRMTAESKPLSWDLKIVLRYTTSYRSDLSYLAVSFELDTTGLVSYQTEAYKLAHQIIAPLATGTVYRSGEDNFYLIPQFSYVLDKSIIDRPGDLAQCLITQADLYFRLRKATEAEIQKVVGYYANIEISQIETHRIVTGELIEFAKGDRVDPLQSLRILQNLTSSPPASA
jgi:hypothetical protein